MKKKRNIPDITPEEGSKSEAEARREKWIPNAYNGVAELAKCLDEAHSNGRPLIPIVGAGISAESGFPVVATIIRYFGKLEYSIKQSVWLRPFSCLSTKSATDLCDCYRESPWKYVRDFGWPDRFQLTEDLHFATSENRSRHWQTNSWVNEAVIDGLEYSLKRTEARRFKEFNDLRARLSANLKEALRQHEPGESLAWNILGDWRRMILGFTGYQGDYADALLAKFAQGRGPNLAHRYLAFLIRRLGVSVVFTMNFDPFIERALEEEDLHPRTFAMEYGRMLPHHSIVHGQLAVVKMHGSTHALLLDEQLDRPLSDEYLRKFSEITGPNPFIFVIGCSGDDNRLLDLLRRVREKGGNIAWLHYEPNPSDSLKDLNASGAVRFQRTSHIGATLYHIFSRIARRHPVSKARYLVHFQQPTLLASTAKVGKNRAPEHVVAAERLSPSLRGALSKGEKFILIETITHAGQNDKVFPDITASRQLLFTSNSLPRGYTLIWVDLEAVHTIAAVAGSIIDQCRKYDTSLVPCVLPTDPEPSHVVAQAVERVRRALRRSRYFVAFDGMETYTWSPAAHHGETHSAFYKERSSRLDALADFMIILSKSSLGDSRLALSIDRSRNRTAQSPTRWQDQLPGLLTKSCKRLAREGVWKRVPLRPGRHFTYSQCFAPEKKTGLQAPRAWGSNGPDRAQSALALSILATFRRTRPLALVYEVLEPVFGGIEGTRKFLAATQSSQKGRPALWLQIEGGGIWFHREMRDHFYAANTRGTGAKAMGECLAGKRSCVKTIYRLLLNAFTHQFVARSWYAGAFIQSHDTFALLEYFYHRLANIRGLTKLISLVEANPTNTRIDAEIADGCRQFFNVIELAESSAALRDAFELSSECWKFRRKSKWPGHSRPTRQALLDSLVGLHREGLERWRLVWERAESDLRAQVPAEQLIRWCDQFLDDDLQNRCDQVITGYDESGGGPDARSSIRCLSPCKALDALKAYVTRFKAKIQMDRSDYEGSQQTLQPAPDAPRTNISANEGPELLATGHAKIDVLQCRFRKSQEEASKVGAKTFKNKVGGYLIELGQVSAQFSEDTSKVGSESRKNMVGARSKKLNPTIVREASDPTKSLYYELELRTLHLQANLAFGRVSVFSHEGFTGAGGEDIVGFRADKAREAILEGRRLVRLQGRSTALTPRSAIIEPVADGTLYLPYRALFGIQHARSGWMMKMKRIAADRIGVLSATMDEALGEFDEARAGLAESNALMLALADLYASECCLACARIALNPESKFNRSPIRASEFARSCYGTASGLLARAQTSLARAARNVVWWRLFFQLTAQYHSDRLTSGLAIMLRRWDSDDHVTLRMGSHFARLRKGFESLRNAHDLYLYNEEEKDDDKTTWLRRVEGELILGGFGLAVATMCLNGDHPNQSLIGGLRRCFERTREEYLQRPRRGNGLRAEDYKKIAEAAIGAAKIDDNTSEREAKIGLLRGLILKGAGNWALARDKRAARKTK